MADILKSRKHPAYHRVMSSSDALDIKWSQRQAEWAGRRDPLECEQPFVIAAIGLPSGIIPDGGPVPIEIPTRCRKCANCLKHRRRLWTARAIAEISYSQRTWFGTLTFHPEARFMIELYAAASLRAAGHREWRELDQETKFRAICDQTAPEVTKWLKRVRRSAGVPLRYLLVTEAHKDGWPHYHLLLHEPRERVTKALLEQKWLSGFSHWRLVKDDIKAAMYACKYLTKDSKTRIRGSVRYGRDGTWAIAQHGDEIDPACRKPIGLSFTNPVG